MLFKVALPTRDEQVDDHFGHCEMYTIFTINEKKEILTEDLMPAPVGCGCKSDIASLLRNMGVSVMLAGNMGNGALNVLNSQGIEVIRGCSGMVRKVTENWLRGELTDSGMGCEAHSHEHSCGNH